MPYNIAPIVNNVLLCSENLLRVDLMLSVLTLLYFTCTFMHTQLQVVMVAEEGCPKKSLWDGMDKCGNGRAGRLYMLLAEVISQLSFKGGLKGGKASGHMSTSLQIRNSLYNLQNCKHFQEEEKEKILER